MEIITDILPLKRYKNRVELYLDSEPFFVLHKDTIKELQLASGSAIEDRSAFKENIFDLELKKALDSSLRYLSQPRTRHEIENKLKQMRYCDDVIKEVSRRLINWGYINDERYKEDFIASYRNKGYGKYAIINKLAKKGIRSNDCVWDDYDEAFAYAQKHLHGKTDRPSINKTARSLYQRGFPADVIGRIMRELGETDHEE